MSGTLDWSDAQRSDRNALHQFTCADPDAWLVPDGIRGRRYQYHPSPWQLNLQSTIRDMKVPCGRDRVLLGRDGEGLVAVARYAKTRDPEDTVYLKVLAISANRWGDGLGKGALRYVLNEISLEPWRTPATELYAHAWVHVDNEASAATCRAVGMEEVDGAPEDYQEWGILLPAVEKT